MPLDETLEFSTVGIALLKILDNRTRTDDAAGDLLVELIAAAGHEVIERERAAADLDEVTDHLRLWVRDPDVNCIITVGGTGLSSRDIAPEALALVWDREIPGFGELFRSISLASVGTSALQSRACAGVAGDTCMFALPGSPGGVRDAWNGILADQLDSRHKPCNLVELMACSTRR
jgi:molybdenum cofactor biosynthesis protein B